MDSGSVLVVRMVFVFFSLCAYGVSDKTRHDDRGRNNDDPLENRNPGTSRVLWISFQNRH